MPSQTRATQSATSSLLGTTFKKLYREIARQIHPDLSTNEVDRGRRTRLMAEANRAYTDGDEVKLRAVLDEWHSRTLSQ